MAAEVLELRPDRPVVDEASDLGDDAAEDGGVDDASVQAIADKLSKTTQAKVLLDRVVDPAILGGVVTQVGSLVYDGSVRTQLEDLRKQLKQ